MKFTHLAASVAAVTVAGVLGSTASAAVIVASDTGRINAATAAEAGDPSTEGRAMRTGTTATNVVFEGFMTFNTSSYTDPLGSALLTLEVFAKTGNPGSVNVYAISSSLGFNSFIDTAGERSVLVSPSTQTLVGTIADPVPGIYNFDVTSWVTYERNASNSIMGFVLEHSNITLNSAVDLVEVYDHLNEPVSATRPQLTLEAPIPEPTSLALMCLSGLFLRRRARA